MGRDNVPAALTYVVVQTHTCGPREPKLQQNRKYGQNQTNVRNFHYLLDTDHH